jgi:hypothetical protein
MNLTHHARTRCQQRSLSNRDLDLVWNYGDEIRQHQNTTAYFLGKRAVKRAKATEGLDLSHLVNTAVVLTPEGYAITAYRNSTPPNTKC